MNIKLVYKIADAIQRKEDDFETDDSIIELPLPQTAGTFTQQRTYALMKAEEIVKYLEDKKSNL